MTEFVYPLRAKMTTAATGTTVTITLGSAVSGFSSFSDAGLVTGDYIKYTIEDANGNWEVGSGYVTISGGTTTMGRYAHATNASSNTSTKINLSGDAVVYATTSHQEVASRHLIYSSKITENDTAVSSILFDWATGSYQLGDLKTKGYTKYEIVLDRIRPSQDSQLVFRIRYPNGNYTNATRTTSNYEVQYLECSSSTDYAARQTYSYHYLSRYNYVGGVSSADGGWSGTITLNTDIDEYQTNQYQSWHVFGGYIDSGNNTITHQSFGHFLNSSFDINGIVIFPISGSISGKVSIYGVRD